jgi:hypothetical protein
MLTTHTVGGEETFSKSYTITGSAPQAAASPRVSRIHNKLRLALRLMFIVPFNPPTLAGNGLPLQSERNCPFSPTITKEGLLNGRGYVDDNIQMDRLQQFTVTNLVQGLLGGTASD